LNDVVSNAVISNDGESGKPVRRRRSWYKRRQRTRRTLAAVAVGVLLAGAFLLNVVHYLASPSLHASQVLSGSFWARAKVIADPVLAEMRAVKPSKYRVRIAGVYPYSLVPGGVKNGNELRAAAARDKAIRRQFAHFDFEHARLIRNAEARAVYLSYRIRDTVFWTRKKVRLHPGELLLTDGNITLRTRCGNQISDIAQPEVSDEEPAEDVLDQPALAVPSAPSMPVRPMLARAELPSGQPMPPQLFGGSFFFPYVPVNVPIPASKKCPAGEQLVDGHCKKKHKPPVAPEPSTMLLAVSGMALIGWRYRKLARPVAA
jgi:PEP-CTERM motif